MFHTALRIRQQVIDALGLNQPHHTQPLILPFDTFNNVRVRRNREYIREQLFNDDSGNHDVRHQRVANELSQYAGMKMTPIELTARILLTYTSHGALRPGQLNDAQFREHFWEKRSKVLLEDEQSQLLAVECFKRFDLSFASQGREWRGADSNR